MYRCCVCWHENLTRSIHCVQCKHESGDENGCTCFFFGTFPFQGTGYTRAIPQQDFCYHKPYRVVNDTPDQVFPLKPLTIPIKKRDHHGHWKVDRKYDWVKAMADAAQAERDGKVMAVLRLVVVYLTVRRNKEDARIKRLAREHERREEMALRRLWRFMNGPSPVELFARRRRVRRRQVEVAVRKVRWRCSRRVRMPWRMHGRRGAGQRVAVDSTPRKVVTETMLVEDIWTHYARASAWLIGSG